MLHLPDTYRQTQHTSGSVSALPVREQILRRGKRPFTLHFRENAVQDCFFLSVFEFLERFRRLLIESRSVVLSDSVSTLCLSFSAPPPLSLPPSLPVSLQIIQSLDEDPAAQSKQLTLRLQRIAAALENKVTDL